MAIDLQLATKRLEAKKQEILHQSELSREARNTVELDQQAVGRLSRMDAMQQQAMAEAQERTRQLDLQRIDMACRRLKDGDYGYCADCDEEIPDGRLAIDPMAEKCVRCA